MKRTISTVDSRWINRKRLDVRYSDVSPNHVLDVYLPDSGTGPFPVIVFVHGGGFLGGSKNYGALAPILGSVSQGYALISVEYRLSMEATWPAGVHDVKCALRFITEHADELGIDPDRIVLWGTQRVGRSSTPSPPRSPAAGSTTSPWDTVTPDLGKRRWSAGSLFSTGSASPTTTTSRPTRHSWSPAPPSPMRAGTPRKAGTRVEDAELGFAIEDDLPRAFAASPIRLVQDEFVPALFQHGTADVIVPFADSAKWPRRSTRGSVPAWPPCGPCAGRSTAGRLLRAGQHRRDAALDRRADRPQHDYTRAAGCRYGRAAGRRRCDAARGPVG